MSPFRTRFRSSSEIIFDSPEAQFAIEADRFTSIQRPRERSRPSLTPQRRWTAPRRTHTGDGGSPGKCRTGLDHRSARERVRRRAGKLDRRTSSRTAIGGSGQRGKKTLGSTARRPPITLIVRRPSPL